MALEHREEALNYAMQFARDMETDLADKFVGMYVNRWTLGYGERGRAAVQELLDRGVQAGLIPGPAKAEFFSDALAHGRRIEHSKGGRDFSFINFYFDLAGTTFEAARSLSLQTCFRGFNTTLNLRPARNVDSNCVHSRMDSYLNR